MTTAAATPYATPETASAHQAVLVVSLGNLHVRYASPLAIEWLGLPADRLFGRSLILSLPNLGQALTLALSGGLSPLPTPLGVRVSRPDGTRLTPYIHQVDADVIVEFQVDEEHDSTGRARPVQTPSMTPAGTGAADPVGLQRRLDEMRQDLAALRTRVPCSEMMLRGDDPILFWLWQAEAALTQISRRFASFAAVSRQKPTPSTGATARVAARSP